MLDLHTVRLYPTGYTLAISFLFEFESIPWPLVQPEDYVDEDVHWYHLELNPRPSGSYRSASTNCATLRNANGGDEKFVLHFSCDLSIE